MASKIKAGKVIEYGGMEWIVLNVERDRLLILARKATVRKAFDEGGSNNFAKSTLCAYLNGEFVKMLESNGADTSAIVATSCGTDTSLRVSLLTVEQYEARKAVIPNIKQWWWLRSPARLLDYVAAVRPDSSVDLGGCDVLYGNYAVRPALWMKHSAADLLQARCVPYMNKKG